MNELIDHLTVVYKSMGRYPSTYACDWVREAGLAADRSQASQWITKHAATRGIDEIDFRNRLADEFIEYYVVIEAADQWRDQRTRRLCAEANQ